MRQLLLDIAGHRKHDFATFVTGRNAELLALLQQMAVAAPDKLDQRFIYLWGEAGSGKTHLLHALAQAAGSARLLSRASTRREFDYQAGVQFWLVDDCQRLTAVQQLATFTLFNQVREHGGAMLSTGDAAPAALRLREDLRTRLAWGLVYHVHGLTDEEKQAALERAAQARGFHLAPGVLPWLITHYRRDMTSLSALLDALDRYSLETKRPVTLPLLKQLLESGVMTEAK